MGTGAPALWISSARRVCLGQAVAYSVGGERAEICPEVAGRGSDSSRREAGKSIEEVAKVRGVTAMRGKHLRSSA